LLVASIVIFPVGLRSASQLNSIADFTPTPVGTAMAKLFYHRPRIGYSMPRGRGAGWPAVKPAKSLPALLILCMFCCAPAHATNSNWPKSLNIATSSPGGVYVPYGRALAKLWTEKLGIPVDAVGTQGAAHNLKLIDLGGAQIGMTTMGIALEGWNGTGEWTAGKRLRNVRALFPMFDTAFHSSCCGARE
jgi:hypothetical protein